MNASIQREAGQHHYIYAKQYLSNILNEIFTEPVIIYGPTDNRQNADINNCKIGNLTINAGEWKNLKVDNSDIEIFEILSASINENITLENCNIKSLKLNSLKAYLILNLINCNIESIEVVDDVNSSKIEIRNCSIQNFRIRYLAITGTIKKHLHIADSTQIQSAKIETSFESFIVSNQTTITNLFIGKISVNIIEFDNSIFKNNLILDSDTSNTFKSNNCVFEKDLTFSTKNRYDCALQATSVNGTLNIKGQSLPKLPSSITIKHSNLINEFTTSNIFGHDKLEIYNTTINKFTISESNSNIFLKAITILGTITFNNTTLNSDAIFDRVHLEKCEIIFINSSIAKAEFHSIIWPNDFKIKEVYSKEYYTRNLELWNNREAYRQLKVVSLSFNNKIDAKEFLKNELRVYYTAVKSSLKHSIKTERNWFKKLKGKEVSDWLILGTNSWFSDFGESLRRPILYLLLFHTIFFWLIIINSEVNLGIQLDWPWNHDWDAFWRGLGAYLNLLSPVHSTEIENVYDSTIRSSIYGKIDFFMRIFSAYFLYYFVKATRKYNFGL